MSELLVGALNKNCVVREQGHQQKQSKSPNKPTPNYRTIEKTTDRNGQFCLSPLKGGAM